MKHLCYTLLLLFAISCGNANCQSGWILDDDGVGSLKMLKTFSDMSSSDEGLYNRIEKSRYVDERNLAEFQRYILFRDNEVVAQFSILGGTAPIDQLIITSPDIALRNGVHAGMSLREAIMQDGVEASIIYDESWNEAVLYIRYGDHIRIGEYGDNKNLTESGERKAASLVFDGEMETLDRLVKANIPVKPEDIREDAVVSCLFVDRRNYGY